MAFTGYAADGRAALNIAKNEVTNYSDYYGVEIPPHVLSERMGHFFHAYTTYGGYRPLGINLVMAGYDQEKKEAYLHMVDPAGAQFRYHGCAAGKSRQAAKTEIEKLDLANMTCAEGLKRIAFIIRIIREVEKDKPFELEAGWVCKETNWKFEIVPQNLRDEAGKWAKDTIGEMEMDESDDEE